MRELKFILDAHLGKLAKYLRLLGFDSLYRNDFQDAEIIKISNSEHRIILTRDAKLLEDRKVKQGYYLKSIAIKPQLIEVINEFKLDKHISAFTRCLVCNTEIQPVEKETVLPQLPPKTQHFYASFYQCPKCQKVYWKGSHFQRMQKFIDEILNDSKQPPS